MSKQTIAGYDIIETIAEGGQAIIYKVRKVGNKDDTIYVAKRLKNHNRIARFEQEIKSVEQLDHKNIIKILESDVEAERAYYIMPYLENGNLNNLDFSNWTLPKRLEYFKIICEAISFTHRHNIIHRDLKPENILLDSKNQPIVSDYGICFVKFNDETRATDTSEAVGPRYYMAPELEDGRVEEIKEKADIYSLGKILYWIISNKQIFAREKHRTSKYDLSIGSPCGAIYMLNNLFDKTIVENETKRIGNLKELVNEIERINYKIMGNYNEVDYKAPQKCIYCGEGNYELLASEHSKKFGEDIQSIGISPRSPEQRTHVYVCSNCGNVQIFNKDVRTVYEKWNINTEPEDY